jgi:hypothetical protein
VGQTVKAIVVKDGQQATAEELMDFCGTSWAASSARARSISSRSCRRGKVLKKELRAVLGGESAGRGS